MNKIIAFEGGDGVGKATQSKLLAERLKATLFSFPRYETETGKAIRAHLNNEWHCESWSHTGPSGVSRWDMMAFQSLMAANRYEAVGEIYKARGHVVMDRYSLSGIVYGTVEGLDPDWLRRIHASLPQPDAWILLDAPVAESFKRRPERRDRNERDREKLAGVRAEYLGVFEIGSPTNLEQEQYVSGGYVHRANKFIVDAVGSVRDVEMRICAALRWWFGRGFLDDKEFYDAEGKVKL